MNRQLNYERNVIRPADYIKLILPFAVLRRFECALAPTREAVCKQAARGSWNDEDPKYCAISGHCSYNVTIFRLSNLVAGKTCAALMAYINGFSAYACEVLQRFEMRQTYEKLDEKGMLYEVCTRFAGFDFGPEVVFGHTTRSLAIDLGLKGIRVNAVCAATIRTPLTEKLFQSFADITHNGDVTAYWEAEAAMYPLGRVGEAHEVAELMYFLASDAASFMTGGLYLVDGGLVAK